MSDPDLQRVINKINSININSVKNLSSIDLNLNGMAATDISSLNASELTTITPVQISGPGAPTYTVSSGTGSTFNWQLPNTAWTTSGTGTTINPTVKAGTVELRGEDADLVVNGKSLMKTLERIEDRLNLLEPNTELEKDWDDLRRLGERYRRLEKKCKEKAETWKKLKAMPPPQVD